MLNELKNKPLEGHLFSVMGLANSEDEEATNGRCFCHIPSNCFRFAGPAGFYKASPRDKRCITC